jgi:two-component system OmpR family response regulator
MVRVTLMSWHRGGAEPGSHQQLIHRAYVVCVRILVVEDEPRMAALLKRGLVEEGYVVDIASNGPDGLWHALEFPYDVVLLDVMLPKMSGVEVCRQMRIEKRWTPVLLLTARDTITDRVTGLDAGADDYLVKPFAFDELSARVRALARRGSVARAPELQVGDLRLDPASRRAWRGDVELELSVKEFAMLRLFLAHPGHLLTRTQILEHVWDYAYDGTSNVVDQYVLYLRRKIDRPFRVQQLETVRGAGYRLREEPVSLSTKRAAGKRPGTGG